MKLFKRMTDMRTRFCMLLVALLSAVTAGAQEIETSEVFAPSAERFRLAAHAGYGYRFGKVDPNMSAAQREFVNKLHHGLFLGADLSWFFREQLGIGARVSNLRSITEGYGTITYEDGTKKSGSVRDQVDILFAGPQLSYRFMGKTGRSALLMNMALGYMAIRDRSKAVSETLQIDGACLGFAMDLTYEYKILDALWLGLQLSALGGSVSSATFSGTASTQKISLEEREGLAHVVVSAGIRYCL